MIDFSYLASPLNIRALSGFFIACIAMSLSKRVCCCGGSFLLSVSVVFGVFTVAPSRFVRFCSQSTLDGLFVGLASPSSECVPTVCSPYA